MSLVSTADQTGAIKYNLDDDEAMVADETDTPWRKAAAWRGKLLWRDRLKPQSHDDEAIATHIVGLRNVGMSLDMIPGVRDKGSVIGAALIDLFTHKPYILTAILSAVKNNIEDASSFVEPVSNIIACIAKITGCVDVRRGLEKRSSLRIKTRFHSILAALRPRS